MVMGVFGALYASQGLRDISLDSPADVIQLWADTLTQSGYRLGRTTMSTAQRFWDKQATNYDSGERQFEPVFENVLVRTTNLLKSTDTVLDFGCATGTKTLAIASSAKRIHGLDFSREMIDVANKKKIQAGVDNVVFSHGTIFDNDLQDASFDKIVSYGVLHLLEDKEKVVRKIHSLLKPGGLFISTTACLKDKMAVLNKLQFMAYLFIKRIGVFPIHLEMMSSSDVERLVASGGFRPAETEVIFHGITISYIVGEKSGN